MKVSSSRTRDKEKLHIYIRKAYKERGRDIWQDDVWHSLTLFLSPCFEYTILLMAMKRQPVNERLIEKTSVYRPSLPSKCTKVCARTCLSGVTVRQVEEEDMR